MQQRIAKTISIVFHPIIIPTYTLFIVFNSGSLFSYLPETVKNFSYIVILISTILLPISILPLLKFQKIITSYSLTDRRERVIPIVLSIIFYFMGFYLINKIPMTIFIQTFFKAMMVTILGIAIISSFWKISIHLSALGGLCAIITYMNINYLSDTFSWLILGIIAAGLLGTSRLLLKRHNPKQIYLGFLWGFLSVSLVLMIS